jgi:hypothetical protein
MLAVSLLYAPPNAHVTLLYAARNVRGFKDDKKMDFLPNTVFWEELTASFPFLVILICYSRNRKLPLVCAMKSIKQ